MRFSIKRQTLPDIFTSFPSYIVMTLVINKNPSTCV